MEEETTGQSKLFVILAVALIGLLVLGLLGIGGVFVIRQNLREQAALAQPTATLVINLPKPTPIATAAAVNPTNTPVMPTPTNTPVVAAGSAAADEAAAVTTGGDEEVEESETEGAAISLPRPSTSNSSTSGAASEAATPSEVPNTGLGAVEAVLVGLSFITVLIVARRMRMRTSSN
ncbi:MAG: hypothetical protein KDJ65_17495 [Anaerolineae bacterium]|nr:hypothetical protein [Anaerolineae bacterium]